MYGSHFLVYPSPYVLRGIPAPSAVGAVTDWLFKMVGSPGPTWFGQRRRIRGSTLAQRARAHAHTHTHTQWESAGLDQTQKSTLQNE